MAAWVQIPHPAPNVEHTDHILNFLWFLKKEGYKESTILNYSKSLRDIAKHVNLDDPEAVKDYIAKKPVSDARKEIIVNCYDKYCKWRGIPFKKPKYRRVKRLPYVPQESDIDELISALGKRLSAFLLTIKETGARPGELWNALWSDLDVERKIFKINSPEKGSNPRAIPVSNRLISMLCSLPKTCKYIFRPREKSKYKTFYRHFLRQRKKVAEKLKNPRIELINFKSLRHFKGTME